MSKQKLTKHHIISRCQDTEFKVHSGENTTNMLWVQHAGLHAYFNNAHHPQAQLQVFYETVEKTLSPDARRLFRRLMEMERSEFYKKTLLRGLPKTETRLDFLDGFLNA